LTEYLTEQEQIQQLKTWVKLYGPTIVLGIVLALIMTTGWRYWQNYQNKVLTHASGVYDEMLASRSQNNEEGAIIQAKKLLEHYRKTPYADMASLLLARDAVLKNDYPEAIKQLDWVIDHSKNNSMREIARIRIARILITEQKADEALALLKKINDKNYMGLIDEVRGDAYLIKQDPEAARKAYQLALQELPNADVTRPILEMKYANLTTAIDPAT
jgi:predicted negative regulator of RcsB-dependent stress response